MPATAMPRRWKRRSPARSKSRLRTVPGVTRIALDHQPRFGRSRAQFQLGARHGRRASWRRRARWRRSSRTCRRARGSTSAASDPTIFPVYGVALTSKTLDQEALRQIAELKVRPALTAVQRRRGGRCARRLAARIRGRLLDPARLAALGISPTDVVDRAGQGQRRARRGPDRGPPPALSGAGRKPAGNAAATSPRLPIKAERHAAPAS